MDLLETIALLAPISDQLEKEWESSGSEIHSFPDLAKKYLENVSEICIPTFDEAMRGLSNIQLAEQTFPSQEFSDLPITLIRKKNFCVDLYYWFNSDTSIHNHHFAGAFKVVKGASLQIEYGFDQTHELDEYVSVGKLLKKEQFSFTSQDEVVAIYPGNEFIHHVFHLEAPTVTLCIRTPAFRNSYLATFLHQDFKLNLRSLQQSKIMWLKASVYLQTNGSFSMTEFPLSLGESILAHYRFHKGQLPLHSRIVELLLEKINQSEYGKKYLKLVEEEPAYNMKIKKIAINAHESRKNNV